MQIEIIPAIQVQKFSQLQKNLDLVKRLVNRVQIDIVGSKFEKNPSIKVEELSRANTSLILDIQLMVKEPMRYLNRCDVVGVERVYGQVEQMSDQGEFVNTAIDMGMEVGLALDIHTPIAAISEMLEYVDGVLLMSVEVGFSGQKFNEAVLDKISKLRKERFERDICIDGGLDVGPVKKCVERGANHFAVGGALWGAENIKSKVEDLRSIKVE